VGGFLLAVTALRAADPPAHAHDGQGCQLLVPLRAGVRVTGCALTDLGSQPSGLAGVGREAVGEREDEAAQFIWPFDDERPVE
jgi:hypothetical protein